MTKLLSLADKMLSKVVGESEAGACVPQQGYCCTHASRKKKYNCYGNCVASSTRCTWYSY